MYVTIPIPVKCICHMPKCDKIFLFVYLSIVWIPPSPLPPVKNGCNGGDVKFLLEMAESQELALKMVVFKWGGGMGNF